MMGPADLAVLRDRMVKKFARFGELRHFVKEKEF